LAVAALDRMAQAQKEVWDGQFSPSRPPLERIRARCEFTYHKQRDLKAKHGKVLGCPLCSLGSEICNQDEQIRDKIREICTRNMKYWESAIHDAQTEGLISAGDPAEKARCVFAYLEGLITQARIYNDAELLSNLGDRVLAHLHAKQPEQQAALV
jgi:TetR/AcrR family transcriptional repressor of nem operon